MSEVYASQRIYFIKLRMKKPIISNEFGEVMPNRSKKLNCGEQCKYGRHGGAWHSACWTCADETIPSNSFYKKDAENEKQE